MDDYYYESHRTFNFKLINTEFACSSSPLHPIKFKFFFEIKLFQWIQNQDSKALHFIRRCNLSKIEYSVHISVDNFLSDKVTYNKISRKLKLLPISDNERNQLVEFARKKALETVSATSVPAYATTLNLDFQIVVEKRSIQGFKSRIVDMLVRTLKKHDDDVVDSGNTFDCSICLEDLSGEGSGALFRLPCRHVFHCDCMDKWLRTAHNCPLCRCELQAAKSY